MNLGIVGSRNFNDYENFKKAILKILIEWNFKIEDIKCIVSGGAKGADTLAERFADEFHINKNIFPVTKCDYNLYGKSAPLRRNTQIIETSTHVIAFPSKYGTGTQDSITKSLKKGIPIKVLFID